jgi:Fe(II)/alpha-ketoglutarate-dependent arginine beta-hydroxylase
MLDTTLGREEAALVSTLVREITSQHASVGDPDLLLAANVLAHGLPARVRTFLNGFRREEPGCCLIRGHTWIGDEQLGATPDHWAAAPGSPGSLQCEVLLLLYGSLLGDIFGWATQQNGHLVHDVLPIRGHESEQLGTGSEMLLTWHTEDAFHPCRPDYVILCCLRNPYHAITTIGNVDDLELAPEDIDVLFQQRFIIGPDNSHLPENNTRGGADFTAIESCARQPEPVAVLFGSRDGLYLRADPYFMDVVEGDEEARRALDHLTTEVDARLRDVVLQPGDCCFIDNYKVVHGRKPFRARYDGTDRWLKRVCVTRDLRKSRAMRESTLSQVVG